MDEYISGLSEEERWEAIVRRDERADGLFLYGVETTGIYCRPTCPSKIPGRKNVRFFSSWEEAERSNYRPCKRCNPRQPFDTSKHQEAVINACRIMDERNTPCSLKELAGLVGLSPFHFHRIFKQILGVTPRQYFIEKRAHRVRDYLRESENITDVLYDSGFGSSSRFYHESGATLGMKPSEFRKGGPGKQIRYTISSTYLGWILIAATQKGICNIEFGDNPESLKEKIKVRFPYAELEGHDPLFSSWVTQILSFLESPLQAPDVPLDIRGTAFQYKVWDALRAIPVGSTATYAQISAQIGSDKACRAVARACASNQLAVIIPCHRVIRKDKTLGGYRWGIKRKKMLLERESIEKGKKK
jgi:AraC family transcriptional regulator, regulatory protein of adaptative response / methylated-DNA-[protein]-cysteine methyltransferase